MTSPVLSSLANTLACLSRLAVLVFWLISSTLSSEACFLSPKLLKELAVVSDLHLYLSQVRDGQPRENKPPGRALLNSEGFGLSLQ